MQNMTGQLAIKNRKVIRVFFYFYFRLQLALS